MEDTARTLLLEALLNDRGVGVPYLSLVELPVHPFRSECKDSATEYWNWFLRNTN